jgi:sugar-specific transcriptional regulator TrmB
VIEVFSLFGKSKEQMQQENQKYLQEIGNIASELEQMAPDEGCREKLQKIKKLADKIKS